MLPYFPQPVIAIGGWNIHAFSVTMASAILVGRGVVLRRARRLGIGYEAIATLGLCALLAGFAGALAEPLFHWRTGLTALGGAIAALLATVVFCRLRGYSYLRALCMLDVLAFAGTLAAALGRLGCALAHEHPGLPSTSWLAVRFPGGPRFDLGLIEFLFLLALCAAFCWLDRRPRPPGFFLFTGMIAYSAFRILCAGIELDPHSAGWILVCLAGVAAAFIRPGRPPQSSHQTAVPAL